MTEQTVTPKQVLVDLLGLPKMWQVAVLAAYAQACGYMNVSFEYEPQTLLEPRGTEQASIYPLNDHFSISDRIGNTASHFDYPEGFQEVLDSLHVYMEGK